MSDEKLVTFVDQGSLAGVIHVPDHRFHRCPLVIFCPGKNGERYETNRMVVKLARQLVNMGIIFFRFDYYGMGLSDGDYHEVTISSKVSNVRRASEYAQRLFGDRISDTVLLGFSDGARTALLAANQLENRHLILWSPIFFETGGNIPGGKRLRFQRHPSQGELVMSWHGLWVGINFYKDLAQLDLVAEAHAYRGKTLLVYGGRDLLLEEEMDVHGTDQYPFFKPTQDSWVVRLEEADHLYSSCALQHKVRFITSEWIKGLFSDGG